LLDQGFSAAEEQIVMFLRSAISRAVSQGLTTSQTSRAYSTGRMAFMKFQGLELPATADMHVHLRDGAMMEVVVPTIRQGGVNTVLVCLLALHDTQRFLLILMGF
jgi:hypothetical protein